MRNRLSKFAGLGAKIDAKFAPTGSIAIGALELGLAKKRRRESFKVVADASPAFDDHSERLV
jgi:hypothetical protein